MATTHMAESQRHQQARLPASHSSRFSSPAAAAAAVPAAAAVALPSGPLFLPMLLLPRGGSSRCSAFSAGSHQGAYLQYFQRGASGSQGSAMACKWRCSTELKGGCREGAATGAAAYRQLVNSGMSRCNQASRPRLQAHT